MTKLEELKLKMESMRKEAQIKAEQIRQNSYNERFSMLRESFNTLSDEEIRQMLRK